MPRLRYRSRARLDLLYIQRYLARRSGSQETAKNFVGKLRDQCKNLAKLPGVMGGSRDAFALGLRAFPYGNYIIYFRYEGQFLDVVAIVERHQNQDTLGADDADSDDL